MWQTDCLHGKTTKKRGKHKFNSELKISKTKSIYFDQSTAHLSQI